MFGHLLCSRWKRGNGQLFFGQCARFAQTALDRFAAGKSFEIPEGAARFAVVAAKKVLGL